MGIPGKKREQVISWMMMTRDYDRFSTLEGNRDVLNVRKNKIRASVERYGQIVTPIIVNERHEIIDGQARFEVFRELNLPIYYIVIPGLTLKECVALNMATTNWSMIDFINSGCAQGNESYIRLKDLITTHKMIPVVALINSMKGVYGATSNRPNVTAIKNGDFTLSQEDEVAAIPMLDYVEQIMRISSGNGPTPQFAQAIAFLYNLDGFDHERLIDKWSKLSSSKVGARRFSTVSEALAILTEVYNYKARSNDLMYFANEYDKYCRQQNAGYANRWGTKKNPASDGRR